MCESKADTSNSPVKHFLALQRHCDYQEGKNQCNHVNNNTVKTDEIKFFYFKNTPKIFRKGPKNNPRILYILISPQIFRN